MSESTGDQFPTMSMVWEAMESGRLELEFRKSLRGDQLVLLQKMRRFISAHPLPDGRGFMGSNQLRAMLDIQRMERMDWRVDISDVNPYLLNETALHLYERYRENLLNFEDDSLTHMLPTTRSINLLIKVHGIDNLSALQNCIVGNDLIKKADSGSGIGPNAAETILGSFTKLQRLKLMFPD